MTWNITYDITGITVVDGIFTVVIKLMFMWLLVMVIKRCIGHYSRGEEGKMFVAGGVGILLLAAIFGFNNITAMATNVSDIFNVTGGSKGSSGGK